MPLSRFFFLNLMYVINPSFLYFIVHYYKIFQNKFEIKIFENCGDIILDARPNVLRGIRYNSYRIYPKQTRLEFF